MEQPDMGCDTRNLDPFKINWFIFGSFCPPHCDWFSMVPTTYFQDSLQHSPSLFDRPEFKNT